MSKFHINPETGRAGQCNAKSPEACKFSVSTGTVVAHYETKEEAKAAYEKLNEKKTVNTLKRSTKKSAESTLEENRKKIATVNRRSERLQANIQERKFKILDLENSLSLDKTKEERDKIHENIKKHREDLLILNKNRQDALKEQKELAKKIEAQIPQPKYEYVSNYSSCSGYGYSGRC